MSRRSRWAPWADGRRQTLVFVAILLLFLVYARGGTPRATLLFLFMSYVVAATIWLRDQYVHFLKNDGYELDGPVLVWVVALGVAAAVWRHDLASSLLIAIIVAYLLVGGFLVLRWRTRSDSRQGEEQGVEPVVDAPLVEDRLGASAKTQNGKAERARTRVGRLPKTWSLTTWSAKGWLPKTWEPTWWGLVLLGACCLLGIVGLLWLWRAPASWPGLIGPALLGTALIVLPVPMSLLSEAAIDRLDGADKAKHRRMAMAVGVGSFAVMAVVARVWADSPWPVAGLVVLALLVIAIASATLTDIAVVVAVIAVFGVTPPQAQMPKDVIPDPTATDTGTGTGTDRATQSGLSGAKRVLVALGDSYMSGEGASTYFAGTDEGGMNQCRRSPTAWAAFAGQQQTFDGLVFLACSGARTRNVLAEPTQDLQPRAQTEEPGTQLAQYKQLQAEFQFQPRLVVLSIGGNDAGFSAIGLMCVAPGNCKNKEKFWSRTLDQVQANLEQTYRQVRLSFENTPVMVIPYPHPISVAKEVCDDVALTYDERKFIDRFVTELNRRIRIAAARYRFYFANDVATALSEAHLQLCDEGSRGRPGIHFIGLRSVNGIADQRFNPANWAHGSFHPNERGHAAMLRAFLRRLPYPFKLAPQAPIDENAADNPQYPPRNTSGKSLAPCDLLDTSPRGCRAQGQRWARQQLAKAMLPIGLVAAAAAASAWLVGVSFFAWRRRAHEDD